MAKHRAGKLQIPLVNRARVLPDGAKDREAPVLLTGETTAISGAGCTRGAGLAFGRAAFGHSARARLEVPGGQVA